MTYTDLLPILIALNYKPVIFSGQQGENEWRA